MSDRHDRRCPERDDEAKVDRMPDEAIKRRRFEYRPRYRLPHEVRDGLLQSEQLEVADQEGAVEHEQPAKARQQLQERSCGWVGDLPDHERDRMPEGKY